jgi:hypothetical protein
MIFSFSRSCLLSTFFSFVSAQYQFLQPNGSLADLSQTYTVGETYTIQWLSEGKGYGQAPDNIVDLFLTSWSTDVNLKFLFDNKTEMQVNNTMPKY